MKCQGCRWICLCIYHAVYDVDSLHHLGFLKWSCRVIHWRPCSNSWIICRVIYTMQKTSMDEWASVRIPASHFQSCCRRLYHSPQPLQAGRPDPTQDTLCDFSWYIRVRFRVRVRFKSFNNDPPLPLFTAISYFFTTSFTLPPCILCLSDCSLS